MLDQCWQYRSMSRACQATEPYSERSASIVRRRKACRAGQDPKNKAMTTATETVRMTMSAETMVGIRPLRETSDDAPSRGTPTDTPGEGEHRGVREEAFGDSNAAGLCHARDTMAR